jgi:putative flippase GtrA
MEKIRQYIFNFLDIFYPIFKPFFNKQTYHYLACGGGNTIFALALYYFFYHSVFHKLNLDLGFIALKPHIASMFSTTLITFPIGFFFTKYIVWSDSTLSGKKQLFRHLNFTIFAIFMNYGLLKLFVDHYDWWAMPSQIFTTFIIVIFSYLTQKYISFKKAN